MVLPLIPLLGVLGPPLLSLVPDLAKWLAGDKAGDVAAQAVAVAQAVTGTTDPVAAAGAIAGMTPEQRMELQIRLAEIVAKKEKDQRDAELAAMRTELEGTMDARKTMVDLAKNNSSLAWMPAYKTFTVDAIFLLVVVGFFVMFFIGLPDLPSGVREIFSLLVGVLVGEWRGSNQFWIGGSRAGAQAANAAVAQAVEAIPARARTTTVTAPTAATTTTTTTTPPRGPSLFNP